MGILRGNRNTGSAALALPIREIEQSLLGRCEAEAVGARSVPADPYAAWLERREDEQARDRTPVRWVYRYPIAAGKLRDRPGALRGGASRRVPGDAEGGLVTVA